MTFKSVAFKCALLVALAFAHDASARPERTTSTTVATVVQHPISSTTAAPREAVHPPQHNTATRAAHKEHHHYGSQHGKLSIANLIRIIGKVIAPLVGAILEPLLVNIAKGITWAITYSLATGFDKPPSYEHFVPALHHHGHGGGHHHEDDEGEGHEYESHKPTAYSLNDMMPELALQLTSTLLSGSDDQGEHAEAVQNAEKKAAGPVLQQSKPAPVRER